MMNKEKIKTFIFKNKIYLLICLIILLIVGIGVLVTQAFFTGNVSNGLLNGKIGQIPSSDSDMTINIYQENRNTNGEGTNTYSIVNAIPLGGYSYNTTSSGCIHGSTLTYNDTTHSYSITASRTDTCNLYFDSVADSDVMINVYKEKRNATGVAQGTYELSDSIPLGGY